MSKQAKATKKTKKVTTNPTKKAAVAQPLEDTLSTFAPFTAADLQSEEMVDPPEASRFLRTTEHTLAVWRCHNRYGLPFIRVGRRIKYRRRDLINFVNSRAVAG